MNIRSIGIVYNLKDKTRTDDLHEEYDEIETILAIKDEIEALGFEVTLFDQKEDLASELIRKRPDMVFNIAEGIGHTRSRESQVPCILESLDIPYTGSDPIALGITLDKYLTNVVLHQAGVPVPRAFSAGDREDISRISQAIEKEGYWVIKPRWEGSSRGIFDDSIASGPVELVEKASRILGRYGQPVLVEEYMPGSEITAAVSGNDVPELLGMMKISPRENRDRFIYSIEQKRDWKKKILYEGEDAVAAEVRRKIAEYATAAFKALSLRDIARIDLRVDALGIPRIIDVNPLPGLSPHYSDLVIMIRMAGRSYGELIKRIVEEALARYGARMTEVKRSGIVV
ncbi:MAG: ATP-grasp domain-containing protein [Candidatus Omnitrophica bacterium]|nr:ATP-grasp domain-containing protein [Candidatus Omnitrophota bacterium]MDD5488283.1 ATP-grasp domain-containing protein [Candidatus Omnitrophota bacterium]